MQKKAKYLKRRQIQIIKLCLVLVCCPFSFVLYLKVKRGNEPICEICRPKEGHKCSHAIVRDGLVFLQKKLHYSIKGFCANSPFFANRNLSKNWLLRWSKPVEIARKTWVIDLYIPSERQLFTKHWAHSSLSNLVHKNQNI